MITFTESGYPQFFDEVPTIRVKDALADFLGAAKDGIIEYRYVDAVRLAGHSCPTVAGAYLMVLRGLEALYDEEDELPDRGGIEVIMQESRETGTTGVIASVATLLTGAATEMGFGGIGAAGYFSRRHLLSFDGEIQGTMALRRRDTGKMVNVIFNPSIVPFAPEMTQVMSKAVTGQANADELRLFKTLWQQRVKDILVTQINHPDLVHVFVV
ncbi:hypothetical protein V757_10010 [Pelistega indica]|uniref:Formylmethanofuran dehydrogenase subunit E domain-containing protein n=1 Tax=Pelistega indica TaxID=1414851 RepID=V8FYT4_9BURK|nr:MULTISPECIES: hypothetical protein [Pelistega]ETD68592.1 hypothetical protein V757_10010 [Pelistega indica]